MYDVIIIGSGVSGAAAAMALSKYKLKICVLEKEEDVCEGTSKANSGIVHAGYDAKPGSLKARLNVWGNELMGELSSKLDIPFNRYGSFVAATDSEGEEKLKELYEQGIANGVPGMEIIKDISRIREKEPNISDDVTAVLYGPTGGVVCPFTLNLALAENACENGAEFFFNSEVKNIIRTEKGWKAETEDQCFESRCVVNAAGVYSDIFHNMVSAEKIHITARKGEYCLLDKSAGGHVKHVIFSVPGKMGKGILVTPTAHGNLLAGPTATDISDKEATNTTAEGLSEVTAKAGKSVKNIPFRQVITSFAGLRAHEDGGDFIIGEVKDAPGFIDIAGVESPGLSAAPAVGELVCSIITEILKPEKKADYKDTRKGIVNPQDMSMEERCRLIEKEPAYGTVICRCEGISEGEILDAIHRPLGAKSLDGIKRRTRAGMGRCQAGFCSPRVMDILCRELGLSMEEITKCGGKSVYITGKTK